MSESKQVLIFPRGQLDSKDRERLTKAGIVAIEADDPKAVVSAIPIGSSLSSDDVLLCALQAVHESTNDNRPRSLLAEYLFRAFKEKHAANNPK